MNIIELRNIFYQELQSNYPKTEIDSFFYLLSESFLHLKRIDIALSPNQKITLELETKFISAIADLKKEIPIQYIIGATEFYGLSFEVNKNVLIPRPETEELVSWIIKDVESKKSNTEGNTTTKINILDIGTGSGCIAVSLAKSLPNTNIYALDISTEALKTAKQNASNNKVEIQFLNDDILKLNTFPIKFDIIVSNPPYVRNLEKEQMQNNVLKYEPGLALFVSNENPLIFYDKISQIAKENLKQNGIIYFEINQYLGNEMTELLQQKGFKNIQLNQDFFEKDRMIKATVN